MSYKFKVSESFAKGLHRIAQEQVVRAAQVLAGAGDAHKGVHEARKTIKRLRALLLLYREGLDEIVYRDLDHRFRDIARALAGLRDIQAMLDSLDLLDQRFEKGDHSAVIAALRAELELQRAEPATTAGLTAATREALRRDLDEAVTILRQIEVPGEGFEVIEEGLQRTYRAARIWHRRAFDARLDPADVDETFHEWRKQLQRHWRHMQLLTPAWPAYLRQRGLATHAMAETIGRDHDLAMLDLRLAKGGRGLGSAAKVRACRARARELQAELRASVRVEGELLFLEGTSAFITRIERYWDAAARRRDATISPEPKIAEEA